MALAIASALAAACSAPADTAALATPSPIPSSTPTAPAIPTPIASPTLPAEPVLAGTTTTDTQTIYQIVAAPLAAPLDATTALERATRIGELAGLGTPSVVYRPNEQVWEADWSSAPDQKCPAPTCLEGYPIDPSYPAIRLAMDEHGSVTSFIRVEGPLAPEPATLLSAAQVVKTTKSKPDRTQLVWAIVPAEGGTFRLAWRLDFANVQPDGERWPCVAYFDAGTGVRLEVRCVS